MPTAGSGPRRLHEPGRNQIALNRSQLAMFPGEFGTFMIKFPTESSELLRVEVAGSHAETSQTVL